MAFFELINLRKTRKAILYLLCIVVALWLQTMVLSRVVLWGAKPFFLPAFIVAIGLWDACEPVDAGKVGFGVRETKVKTNRPKPEELPEGERIWALHKAGRDSEIPGTGMQRTTNIAAARRIAYLKDGPDYFDFPLSAVTVGGALAFVGFPGEPFTAYGRIVK